MSTKYSDAENKWKKDIQQSLQRDYSFKSASGDDVDLLYYPDHNDNNYCKELNFPGQYPYTRGIHPNLYRGKLWTMRQFAGFGTPDETNKRFKHLLKQGQNGLSVAFDLPTQIGYSFIVINNLEDLFSNTFLNSSYDKETKISILNLR